MTFEDVIIECCMRENFVKEYDRLRGSNLSRILLANTRPPIIRMIDEATGFDKELDKKAHDEMGNFITFIFEYVWLPLLPDITENPLEVIKNV
jgi:hypothetical protein